MDKTKMVLTAVLLSMPALLAQTSSGRLAKPPSLPTVSQVSAYLDRASTQLDTLVGLTEREAGSGKIDGALKEYTRKFSRFHLGLGRLPVGKQEQGFVNRLPDQLHQQLLQLASLDEKVQPGQQVALNQAVSHVKGALLMVLEKVGKTPRGFLKVQTLRPEQPGSTSALPGDAGFSRLISRRQLWR